jgi:membrane-associated protease RseP (regulator of RpoE activity)
MRLDFLVVTTALFALSTQHSAGQQPLGPCPAGPGAAFGVTAYQCASCTFKLDQQGRYGPARSGGYARAPQYRPTYGFNTEPIVLETVANSLLQSGDVIEAVNAHPITTRAGSDLFTYPPTGTHLLRVRRGNTRLEIPMQVTGSCNGFFFSRDTVRATTGGRGRGSGTGTPDPRRVQRDSLRTWILPDSAAASIEWITFDRGAANIDRRFGFAVSCLPSCTRARARDGSLYYRFDGHPPVIDLVPGGVAEAAGVRRGDQIVEIDGLSILEEEGALRFLRSTNRESMQVTVLRNGERIAYTLRVR